MRLKGFFAELNASQRTAERIIDEQIQAAVIDAWESWLIEFLRIVPVWTGQSVGSILPLANLLGQSVSINAPQGFAPGNRSTRGATESSATLSGGGGKWFIEYQTAVKHLIINEQIDATVFGFKLKQPGPYNFQEQCAAKFMEVASQVRLRNLSTIFDFDKRSF